MPVLENKLCARIWLNNWVAVMWLNVCAAFGLCFASVHFVWFSFENCCDLILECFKVNYIVGCSPPTLLSCGKRQSSISRMLIFFSIFLQRRTLNGGHPTQILKWNHLQIENRTFNRNILCAKDFHTFCRSTDESKMQPINFSFVLFVCTK